MPCSSVTRIEMSVKEAVRLLRISEAAMKSHGSPSGEPCGEARINCFSIANCHPLTRDGR